MAYSSIVKPSDYFNTKLYTGNGSTQSITGVGFQPDWIWNKTRNATGNHVTFDAVRGTLKRLKISTTDAETSSSSVTSFDSDGYGLAGEQNTSGTTYASWNWLGANGTASNTDGSITSTVSANTTSGFSIVKVAKPNTNVATIGHGLGATPKFIIGKDLDSADNWTCYHESLGNDKGIYLNATNSETNASTFWDATSPTSSVFTIGSDNTWNSPSIVFYCFAPKTGYSKFGSYTGNGNADGTFVYTGFKPAFVITKGAGNISSWSMTDSTISTFNDGSLEFFKANEADAESSRSNYDILSNGFKMRTTDADYNGSGNTYIYMAFAENPLVANSGTDGVPATAR